MTARHDGYVVDVPYVEPVFPELCPAWLSMISVLNGQPPLPDRPLVWAELGFGSGLQACVVAAANADITVWGCDINPVHVERARGIAEAAGISNCTFDLASFEEVAFDERLGPREVDVVVVHGVYSWVSTANHRHIAEFVQRRLRPGGLVHVSYEAPTGWSALVPVAEAFRLLTDADPRPANVSFGDAYSLLSRLREAGGDIVRQEGHEHRLFTELATADPKYAVHEYLHEHFRPLMFDEVADVFADAGCSYVGSIETTDHRPAWWVAPDLLDLVTGTDDVVLREMLRDVCTQRALRRSVFRRGLAHTTAADRDRWTRDLRVIGLGKSLTEGATIPLPVGDVNLDLDYHQQLMAALHHGPLDVERVMSMLGSEDVSDALLALCVLVAGAYAAPMVPARPDSRVADACLRLNRLIVDENRRGGNHSCVVASTTGSVVIVDYVETLALGALWDGERVSRRGLVDHCMIQLASQGRAVRHQGRLLTEARRARRVVGQRVDRALSRRSVLSQTG